MKKLLAVLLALVMALGCVPALAEDADVPEMPSLANGLTVAGAVQVNADGIKTVLSMLGKDVPEDMAPLIDVIANVINQAGVQVVVAENGAKVDLILKDANLLTVNLAETEDGIALATDLLPEYVFTVKKDTLTALVEQAMSQYQAQIPEGLDVEALMTAVSTHVNKLVADFTATIGETEEGEFTVNGLPFTFKTPINITTKQLATMILTFAKDLASEEALAPILSSANVDLSQIDEAIASIESTPDEEVPATEAAMYSDAAGNQYLSVVMSKDEQSIQVYAGTYNGHIMVSVSAMDQLSIDVQLYQDGNSYNLSVLGTVQGIPFGFTGVAVKLDDGYMIGCDVYLGGGDDALLSAVVKIAMSGEVAPIDLEGKTVISVEEIMADQDGTASAQIGALLQTVPSVLLGRAMEAMPEEFSVIMQMIMPAPEAEEAAE